VNVILFQLQNCADIDVVRSQLYIIMWSDYTL